LSMNVLVCVKRVAMVGSRIVLTADSREVDVRQLGFTMSPHEECAVEEAIRIVEHHGGVVTVMTLGPAEASEQLRDAASLGATKLVHLVSDGREWDPMATAEALVSAVWSLEADGETFDLILFGNEAADTGDYQVGVRVAQALGRPSVSGVKHLEVGEHDLEARREYQGGEELYEIALPCVVAVKEGINLPRYPSLPGRMRAKKVIIEEVPVEWREGSLRTVKLRVPEEPRDRAEILGVGVEGVGALVALFDQWGILS
jgi:electron transfer flavoprotein beta subunit